MARQTLTLACGRAVSVVSLEQWSVYAGLLEGLPTRELNKARVDELLERQRRRNQHEPVLLEPVQTPIDYPRPYPFGEPASLPDIGCVAVLHSHEPARDPSMDYSELAVIWFQDDYAFPLSEQAERAIIDLDWTKLARDGSY